jgi:ribose transport system permease protein
LIDSESPTVEGESPPVDAREPRAPRRGSAVNTARDLGARFGVLGFLLLLVIFFSIKLPDSFPTSVNFKAMIASQAVLLILALAVTIPLRAGDFDLSIGATMVFSSSIVGVLTAQHGVNPLAAGAVAVIAGLLVGFVNAFLIVAIGVDAFVTTLGTMTALTGLTLWVTDSEVVYGLPDSLLTFSRYEIFGLPLAAFYGWVLAVLLWCVYEYLPLGRYLLFVGGNREATRLAGVRVNRIRTFAFVASAVISAFGGVVLAGILGAVDPSSSSQFLLPPYAAAFLGTTTIQLGRFNIVGTVIALYLLVVGITGLQLMGAAPWISDVFNGCALLTGVVVAKLVGRRTST